MPVTTDWIVAKAIMDYKKKPALPSAQIAELLKLTVFQITARLKGMEGRELVERDDKGRWGLTPDGLRLARGSEPPPPVPRIRLPGSGAVPAPSDEGVRRVRDTTGVTISYVYHGSARFPVFTDLHGKKWVECHRMETAQAIREFSNGLTPMRLRPYAGSTAEKLYLRHKREKAQQAERAEALARSGRMGIAEAKALGADV